MLAFFKDNFALYLSILLLAVGLGFQGAFIAPIGSNVGIENSLLNYVMNAYYIGFLAGVYIVPKLIDKVNYVRSFAILGTTFSAIFIGFALFQDFPSWVVLRVLSGVCFSGLYLITESWINSSIENDNRGNAISLYLVFMFIGILFGNYIIRFADHNGLQILAMMSFMLSLSFIPVLLMRYEP
ncbi:MAG: MFS transporter, partial [Alphaproteobacteria bacterium]